MTVISQHPRALFRENAIGETARDAARYIEAGGKAKTLRQHVLDAIEAQSGTPEELWARLKSQGVDHLLTAVRPRCSELARMGLIKDSGERGLGESQRCRSIRWAATNAAEREAWAAAHAAKGDQC